MIRWLRRRGRMITCVFAAYGAVHAVTHALALLLPADVEFLLRLVLIVPAVVGFRLLWDLSASPPDTPLDTPRAL